MEKLDLHGISHSLAENEIRKYLNFIELPCEVITGDSQKMKSILKEIVIEYGWFCYEKDSYNNGAFIVVEKNLTF